MEQKLHSIGIAVPDSGRERSKQSGSPEVRAVSKQLSHIARISGCSGTNQRCKAIFVADIDLCVLLQQLGCDRTGSEAKTCRKQSGGAILCLRIYVGAPGEQQFQFGQVVNGPEERGRALIARKIGICAAPEQKLHQLQAAIQRGVHQRRCSILIPRVDQLPVAQYPPNLCHVVPING